MLALGAATLPVSAFADPPADIVVTGQGLPQSVGSPAYGSVTIDRARLENSASGRIENLLTDVAGFQQFRRSDSRSANPSAQGVTLRALGGNASSRTLVLLDGVPQADPFFGYIPFSAITPERLSSVRVTRGGGAGAFGAGAVAGTIELSSATRAQLPRFSGSALFGSDDAAELTGGITANLGSGFINVSGRFDRGDGFFTAPRRLRIATDVRARYESLSLALRAVTPLWGTAEIQTQLRLFRDDRTLRFKGADSSSDGEDASIRLVARGKWQVDALAYLQTRNFTNIVVSATSLRPTLDQRKTPSTGIGGKIELRPPAIGGHQLRLGADARLADGQLFEDAISAASGLVTARRSAGGWTRTIGAFVEDDWRLGRITLTGGIRADRVAITDGFFVERNAAGTSTIDRRFNSRSGWQATGRLGVVATASDTVTLRAAAYTGFRLPTLNELYRPFTVFPVTTRANDALGRERLKGAETGVDLTPSANVKLSVTGFYNRLDGAIANVTIGTNLRQRQNVDAIVAKGIELTANARVASFMLSASYAYSDARVSASGASAGLNRLRPAQSPRHSASTTLAWEPVSGAAISGTVRYVGQQFEDDLQTDVLGDALTLDVVARLPLKKRLTLITRAENIFDAKVVTRKVGNSVDHGAPRIFWIGLRISG